MEQGHVKVVNHGDFDYTEVYQGKTIHIPKGNSIEMPRAEAQHFIEQWRPFHRGGSPQAQGQKPLHIEEDPEQHAAKRDQPFKYVADDGTKFRTKAGLAAHKESLNFKPSGGNGGKKNRSA